MTRFTAADEIGADDHGTIADRVTRGVAGLDLPAEPSIAIRNERCAGDAVAPAAKCAKCPAPSSMSGMCMACWSREAE